MNEIKQVRKLWNLTNLIAMSTLVLFLVFISWWFYDRAGYIHVTDARVSATMVSVSSRMPGWVTSFPVEEGGQVKRGDLLVQIDARDTQLQLSHIDASLKTMDVELSRYKTDLGLRQLQIKSNITASRSHVQAAESALSESSIKLKKAQRDFDRAKSLLADKMVSEEDYDNREVQLKELVQVQQQRIAERDVARAELEMAQASIAELEVMKTNNEITLSKKREMQVERERLQNALADYKILSSIDGVVDETFANAGEYVYPGQRILMLHNPADIWIKSNIKETDIRHLRIGQHVEISVDAYPDDDYEGKISNIGNAATSQFALLPSPNPSGNFTKVTQRIEVQVELAKSYPKLRPGMMVELAIDLKSAETDTADDAN